jgi:hypothetical protein
MDGFMIRLIFSIILLSQSSFATVTVPLSQLTLKQRVYEQDLNIDEKNFWHAKEIFKRLGQFGIELNEKGRCRYLTRKKLLKYGSQADWDCFFAFRGIVREMKYCAPENWDIPVNTNQKVKGLLRYVGVAPLPYKYDLIAENGKLIARTSIYYKGFYHLAKEDQKEVREKISQAIQLWNEKTPAGFPYEIDVQLIDKKENAHFKVNIIKDRTRGPYLKEHSVGWSYRVFAHEIGHMLGLDDEYDQIFATLFGNSRCTNDSMMCGSHKTGFPRYYWYLIFRRAQCV